jgi:hypothetical protein
MGLLDFFTKRKEPLLARIPPELPEADAVAVLPGFVREFLHTVQNYSIQFYRDIHSHDSSGFPAVKEEFCYLLLFVAECRLREGRDRAAAERLLEHVRILLTDALATADRSFQAVAFWGAYRERSASYGAQHASSLVRGKLLAVFNAQLLARLHDWPKLIAYHGAEVAAEALAALEGEADGK